MHFSENQKLNNAIIARTILFFNIHDIYDLYNHFKRDVFLCVWVFFNYAYPWNICIPKMMHASLREYS